MKSLALLILSLLTVPAHAEMFFGPSSTTNRLVMEEGEAIILQTHVGNLSKMYFSFSIIISNAIYPAARGLTNQAVPTIVAGPAELLLGTDQALQFIRIHNADGAIGMLRAGPDATNTVLHVPEGRQVRFFSPAIGRLFLKLQHPKGHALSNVSLPLGQPLDGPLTIECELPRFTAEQGTIIASYWISESIFSASEVFDQGSPGPLFSVDSSTDLTNWQCAAVIRSRLGSNAFYRVSVARSASPSAARSARHSGGRRRP